MAKLFLVGTLPNLNMTSFRARKYLQPDEINRLFQELSDEEDSIGGSDSEGENEVIQEDDHDSDSEQSLTDLDEDIREETQNGGYNFYVGKDGLSLWIDNPLAVPGKTKSKNIIKVLPGPKRNARDTCNERAAFVKFITEDMIDDIVRNTNLYIGKKRSEVEYARARDCKNTTRTEIMALFGVLFLISVKRGRHTNVVELWASNGTGMVILRAVFSYKRFLFLLRSLRFDDITTRKEREATDKLAAIRDFHRAFIKNCQENYSLGEFTTIDEMLIPFRGRCGFVQYLPNKPAKYGLKLYALCDSKTFYTWSFEVYCGKQRSGPYITSNKPMDIVKRLVEPIQNTHRNVTTDNYYSSYPLAEYLLEKGLTSLGTLKKNKREIPPEFLPSKTREVGSNLFGFQDDFALVSSVTKKNKAVILLSTMHDNDEVDCETNKSLINLDYNATKGGVDTVDQMCASYSTQRKSRRWPLALFFRHLDLAGINSQVLFFANDPEKVCRRRLFLSNLAFALMEDHLKDRSSIRTLPKDLQLFLYKYRSDQETMEEPIRSPGRCHECGGHKNIKTTVTCNSCRRHVCKKHSVNVVTCNTCQGGGDESS